MQTVTLKQGDTFVPTCTYLAANGSPADYVGLGITITSQVRDAANNLIGTLAVTQGVNVGEFILTSGSTKNWPVGTLYWDISFVQGSHIFSTSTAAIAVSQDVTQ